MLIDHTTKAFITVFRKNLLYLFLLQMEQQPAQPIIFYGNGLSSNAFRVRVYLKEKGLKYEEKPVDLLAGEHKKPEFLKINPRGQGLQRSLYGHVVAIKHNRL